ncbi:uncharacterized protein LOC115093430 [Rhinatrema bivittatum]|uniref:uncharacterized protein LOC115093430 n=1 Tax=Rhinatrema bivittatum TaxID=194408 RepID=UPI001129AD76|nr:uncharacterized protein LOC115093430 [Rhinatrema bivittatum]
MQRASLRWMQQLLSTQDLPSAETEQAERLEGAIAYGADALYDLLRVQAKAMASTVSARCLLWLCNWSADASSKAQLGTLPFKGKLLFGEDLEQLIKFLGENKVHKLPEDRPKQSTSFFPTRTRFRGQRWYGNRARGSYPRGGVSSPSRGLILFWTVEASGMATSNTRPPSPLPNEIRSVHSSARILGGRLSLFREEWANITSDHWVLEVIEHGYALEFARDLSDLYLVSPCSPSKRPVVCQTLVRLQELGAIIPVPVQEQCAGQYSIYFVIPKKDNSFHPILDLKRVNRALRVPRFKIKTLRVVIAAVCPGEFLASLDLTEAYLHIPILQEHQKFLCFHILG